MAKGLELHREARRSGAGQGNRMNQTEFLPSSRRERGATSFRVLWEKMGHTSNPLPVSRRPLAPPQVVQVLFADNF